jgi:hypothetical protein
MSVKISNSAKDKYQSCPRKYYYHYIEKLRSPKVFSSLFFGNALDDAFSRMLLEKKKDLTENEKAGLEFTPQETFASRMLETTNDAGQIVQIPQSNLADYYTSDFDASLFTPEIVALVQKMEPSYNNLQKIVAFHEYCKTNLSPKNKNKKRLSDDEFILYNYINWLSLNEKGKLMVKAYQRDIIPQIHEVYDIQKEISIMNEMGDEIRGKIDLIASFTDKPEVPFICDNKTSSKAYADSSVAESEQLSTYSEAENNPNGAYIVVQKTVFKKEPKIHTQIVKDVINNTIIEKTFDIYAKVCENISAAGSEKDNYPQNWNSCFEYGKICPYYQICKHNSKGNLISCKKEEKNESDK